MFNAGNAFPIVPPVLLGLTDQEASLGNVVLDHEQQRSRHATDVREVRKHHQCHEL
ncbi:MAG: hypothetical protein ACK55I_46370 [bacterium]